MTASSNGPAARRTSAKRERGSKIHRPLASSVEAPIPFGKRLLTVFGLLLWCAPLQAAECAWLPADGGTRLEFDEVSEPQTLILLSAGSRLVCDVERDMDLDDFTELACQDGTRRTLELRNDVGRLTVFVVDGIAYTRTCDDVD